MSAAARLLPAILTALLVQGAGAAVALPVSESAVSFPGAGKATIHATLTLPAHPPDARVPALVLIAGSGPVDRDGNVPSALTTDLLKQLANGLAQRGIATLRFDKRGMYANKADWPKDPANWAEFCRWEHFVGDVQAAYQFLDSAPDINPAHVGLLGHSEGGLLALEAVAALHATPHPPSVVILASTPGRPLDAIITDQLTALLKQQGATPEQTKYYLTENTRIARSVRETGHTTDVPAGLAALYPSYLGPFLQSEFAIDPLKLAAAYPGPVLIIAGEKDAQVSATKDAGALDAALKKRAKDDHQLLLLPETSHHLKTVKAASDPGFSGPLAPDLLDRVAAWAGAKLR